MSEYCTCGDNVDDHGGDPKFPGSTACNCDGCACVAFESDPDVVSVEHTPAKRQQPKRGAKPTRRGRRATTQRREP